MKANDQKLDTELLKEIIMIEKLTYEQCINLMPELKGYEIKISDLKGGITNRLYRVRASNGGDYVFRIYGQRTEMFIDREAEYRTMQLLESFRILPRLIKYIPEQNVTIIEFIYGYTMKNQDFLKEEFWEKIIRPIKILHKSGVSISRVFDPLNNVKHLYNILEDVNPNYPEFDISGTIGILENIDEVASISQDEYIICHNDLLADNFLLTKDRERFSEPMYLLDWEYAGMGTYYYEFADMFQEILVPRGIEKSLLEIYFEGKDMEHNIYMTDLFKPFPDIFWFLWSLIQLNISTIEFDYYNYGKVKYENAKENIVYIKKTYGIKI